jgi:hypothetical protein
MRHAYPFVKGTRNDRFTFHSTGRKGVITKAVFFDVEEDGLYSVVMGDLNEQGQLMDFQPTGNGDAKKVLATVADIIEYFLEQKPTAIVFMVGAYKRLTHLYKDLLLKELDLPGYVKEGLNEDGTAEPINPEKEYEGYFLFRENP